MDGLYMEQKQLNSAIGKNLESYPFLMPYVKQAKMSVKSLTVYCNRFVQFIQYLNKQHQLEILSLDGFQKVNKDQIESFIENNKDSQTSKKSKYYALSSLFNYLEKNCFVKTNPMALIASPKVSQENSLNYLSTKELSQIYKFLEKDTKSTTKRDLAMFSVAINTGLRISTMLELNIENIQNKKILLEEFAIKLDKQTMKYLEDYLQTRNVNEGPLFVGKNNKRLSVRAYEKVLDNYEPIIHKKVNPQLIRATYAHKALLSNKSSVEIAKQMGISPVTLVSRYLSK